MEEISSELNIPTTNFTLDELKTALKRVGRRIAQIMRRCGADAQIII